MMPMALDLGESGKQSAPIGRAVIGGLVFATVTPLLVLPALYAILQGMASVKTASIDPDDADGSFFDPHPPPG